MSSFKDFMDKAQESPNQNLPASTTTLASLQYSLAAASCIISSPFLSVNEEQKFSEKVSSLVHDKAFISEFSDRISEPSEQESEDDFIERSSDVLRKMLYKHFGIKG
ncbi:hypothetical protein B7486_26880 [cyanobacterium TDX16]|nr:hypothetical protein B7486_26880 [cyanobacterium TDX16]